MKSTCPFEEKEGGLIYESSVGCYYAKPGTRLQESIKQRNPSFLGVQEVAALEHI